MFPVVLIVILIILIAFVVLAFIETLRLLACGLLFLCFLALLG